MSKKQKLFENFGGNSFRIAQPQAMGMMGETETAKPADQSAVSPGVHNTIAELAHIARLLKQAGGTDLSIEQAAEVLRKTNVRLENGRLILDLGRIIQDNDRGFSP